jgi:hypothetical protein
MITEVITHEDGSMSRKTFLVAGPPREHRPTWTK